MVQSGAISSIKKVGEHLAICTEPEVANALALVSLLSAVPTVRQEVTYGDRSTTSRVSLSVRLSRAST